MVSCNGDFTSSNEGIVLWGDIIVIRFPDDLSYQQYEQTIKAACNICDGNWSFYQSEKIAVADFNGEYYSRKNLEEFLYLMTNHHDIFDIKGLLIEVPDQNKFLNNFKKKNKLSSIYWNEQRQNIKGHLLKLLRWKPKNA